MEFFWAMGVPIYEGYGLTETSPILTLNRLGRVRPGYVGQPILKTWNGRPFLKLAEDGEILCQGPNVMRGYWKQEAATREVFDEEGYFRTGDVGEMDAQGRVKITDRKKEIIVTNGGKNVAPRSPSRTTCARTTTSSRRSWWATAATTWRRSSCPTSPPCAPGASASPWRSRTTPRWWRTPGWWPSS